MDNLARLTLGSVAKPRQDPLCPSLPLSAPAVCGCTGAQGGDSPAHLSPVVVAQGSPSIMQMCLLRGLSRLPALPTAGCPGIRTAAEFWVIHRAGTRTEQWEQTQPVPVVGCHLPCHARGQMILTVLATA